MLTLVQLAIGLNSEWCSVCCGLRTTNMERVLFPFIGHQKSLDAARIWWLASSWNPIDLFSRWKPKIKTLDFSSDRICIRMGTAFNFDDDGCAPGSKGLFREPPSFTPPIPSARTYLEAMKPKRAPVLGVLITMESHRRQIYSCLSTSSME